MGRGIRRDLIARFERAEGQKTCVHPSSACDQRRLRDAARRGDLVEPAPGIFARPTYWSDLKCSEQALHKVRALAKAHPSWVFCGPTAALILGLSVSHALVSNVHIATTPKSHTRSTSGITRHIVRSDSVIEVGGLRVTPLEQTVFDCTRSLPFRDGLAIADSALRVHHIDRDRLREFFEAHHKNIAGRRQALTTLWHANGLAENGGESIARAIMIEQGFVVPELQHLVTDPVNPSNSFRVDFWWEIPGGQDIAGELDGHEKYENPEMTGGRSTLQVMSDERRRESRVCGSGAKIMRFSYAEMMNLRYFVHLLDSFGVPRVVAPEAAGGAQVLVR